MFINKHYAIELLRAPSIIDHQFFSLFSGLIFKKMFIIPRSKVPLPSKCFVQNNLPHEGRKHPLEGVTVSIKNDWYRIYNNLVYKY